MDLVVEPLFQASLNLAPEGGAAGVGVLALRVLGPKYAKDKLGADIFPIDSDKDPSPRFSLVEKLLDMDTPAATSSDSSRGSSGRGSSGRGSSGRGSSSRGSSSR